MRIRDWSSDVCSSDLLDRADVADWQRRLYAKGWVAPNWPKAFGGTGWTAIQKYIFDVECGVANAPEISLIALSMVGPVLGSEERRVGTECVGPCISRGSPYR